MAGVYTKDELATRIPRVPASIGQHEVADYAAVLHTAQHADLRPEIKDGPDNRRLLIYQSTNEEALLRRLRRGFARRGGGRPSEIRGFTSPPRTAAIRVCTATLSPMTTNGVVRVA